MANRMSFIQEKFDREKMRYDELILKVSKSFENSALFVLNCETVGGKFSEFSEKTEALAENIYSISSQIDEDNFPLTKDYLRTIGNQALNNGNEIGRKYYNAINTVSRKVYDDYMELYNAQIREAERNIQAFNHNSNKYNDIVRDINTYESRKSQKLDESEKATIDNRLQTLRGLRKVYLDKTDDCVNNLKSINDSINEVLEKGLKRTGV